MHDAYHLLKYISRQKIGVKYMGLHLGKYNKSTANSLFRGALHAPLAISYNTEFHAPTPIQLFSISNPDGPWVVACSPLSEGRIAD